MANSTDSLLPELVAEILIRLPVKSLLRCKSVCKSWLSLISNPSFIKSHLNFALLASKTNPTLLVLEIPHKQVALNMDDSLIHISCVVMPKCFVSPDPVVGSCNGIVCLDIMFGAAACLWNPCTNMWKTVWAPTRGTRVYRLGFGYDRVLDDYKVVRIVYEDSEDDVPVVQLYSSKANCWRQFQDPVLSKWKPCYPYGRIDCVVNGVLYLDCHYKLVSFDFHEEVFRVVLFPMDFGSKRSDVLDYEGCVAVVFESAGDGRGGGVDLWTLDDVSDRSSWTKRFSVKDDWEMWLSGYLGVGQFYGGMSSDQTCYLYDSETKELRFYRVRGYAVCATLRYTESLVSFDGFKQVQRNDTSNRRDGRRNLEIAAIYQEAGIPTSGKNRRCVPLSKVFRKGYRTIKKKPDTDFFTSD